MKNKGEANIIIHIYILTKAQPNEYEGCFLGPLNIF